MQKLEAGEHLDDDQVELVGRVSRTRTSGRKLTFLDISGSGQSVQVVASLQRFSDKALFDNEVCPPPQNSSAGQTRLTSLISWVVDR